MTCALLVQGNWTPRWLERWHHYQDTFDQIVVSCYKDEAAQLLQYDFLVQDHKVTWVLNDRAFPTGVDWYGNIWYQCKTTLAGLAQVRCDHVIKTRTDEYWSNMNLLRDRVISTDQYVGINIYFKKWNVFPLHIGDHLFGGPTNKLIGGFRLLRNLLSTDYFQNTHRAAEQKICASLLMNDGEQPQWHDCRDQLRKHWQVISAEILEPFWFNAPSVGTFGSTLTQIAQCEQHNKTVVLYDHIDKYLEP